MSYVDEVLKNLIAKNKGESEFIQAATEVLHSLTPVIDKNPHYQKHAILERLTEPDRQIIFSVAWTDDSGQAHVNRGFRVQFNNAIGPYKGGLRFNPNVSLDTVKFLGFEQIFKNSLTGLPIGGGKGGSDFDPKNKSDNEVFNFCQSFMSELYKYVGAFEDIPAGDMGVGAREIGYMYGTFKKLTGKVEGFITGKGIPYGGSKARKEATGYGLVYFVEQMLLSKGESFKGKNVVVSGSGNVAIYAAQKASELGGKVVAMSDTSGYIFDKNGIDLSTVIDIKEVRRKSLAMYTQAHPHAQYVEGKKVWEVPCDIALPCATQNEINEADARLLVKNKVIAVGEGANMPSSNEAVNIFIKSGVLFAPAKAANAGGVATSALEMTQNSIRYSYSFEEVDKKLHSIMKGIYAQCVDAAQKYGYDGNLAVGANIAGFEKVAQCMLAFGVQ